MNYTTWYCGWLKNCEAWLMEKRLFCSNCNHEDFQLHRGDCTSKIRLTLVPWLFLVALVLSKKGILLIEHMCLTC